MRGRRGEAGIAMAMALISTMVLALITAALSNLALSEYATAVAVDRGIQAFYVADGAVERALAHLRTDPNWDDGTGVDALADDDDWEPLLEDGDDAAIDHPFPASGTPVGQYSIYLRKPAAADALDPVHNIWLRVVGRTGRSTRAMEVLAHRLTPADFMAYSAQSVQVESGGGNVTIHGSAYFHADLGLKAVLTGIYNDRPVTSTDTAPYDNQVVVKGTLDMSTGNSTVGTSAQWMAAVHAIRVNLKNDGKQNLWTYVLDNNVPVVPYPEVAAYITDIVDRQAYGNKLSGAGNTMLICKNLIPLIWTEEYVADLAVGSTYFVVPTKAYGKCDAGVTLATNHMLIWDPGLGTMALNSTQKDLPVLVPGVLTVSRNVTVQGIGTFIVRNQSNATLGMEVDGGQVLVTKRASQSCGSTSASTMPQTDLPAFLVGGSVQFDGGGDTCAQEQNVVVIAGSRDTDKFASTKKVQMYGMVISKKLDTAQNPDFFQVTDLTRFLPKPITGLMTFRVTMPVVVRKWRELY